MSEIDNLKNRITALERLISNMVDINYAKPILNNTLTFGDGTDSDIAIYANNADANKPGIKYNKTTNTWQRTNDGTTWANF